MNPHRKQEMFQPYISVQKVSQFRQYQHDNELVSIPEISENRKLTDVGFLVLIILCGVIQVSLMGYAFAHSDVRRLVHGMDYCGNICGVNNDPHEGIPCSGQDMTHRPYSDCRQVTVYYYTKCVQDCFADCSQINFNDVDGTHCRDKYQSDDFYPYIVRKLQEESTNLIILSLAGLGLAVLALLLFHWYVPQFVWTMIVLNILALCAVDGILWYLMTYNSSFLSVAIVYTFILLIVLLFFCVLLSQIKLLIYFIECANKAVFSMPLLLIEPFLTFLLKIIVLALFAFTVLVLSNAGTLQVVGDGYRYVPDTAMNVAFYFAFVMAIWMVLFVLACQQVVISGAIGTYYFAKDKLAVVSPIYTSFYNLVRYHLGSAAFGSLLLTIVTAIHIMVSAIASQQRGATCVKYCVGRIETLMRYLSSMGYVQVSLNGQNFCRSCLRSLNLIVANYLSWLAMNRIGTLIFMSVKILCLLVTIGIGYLLSADYTIVVLGGVVAFISAHCLFVVFEIAVDTIFVCYCEDQCLNDGTTRPFSGGVEFHNQIRIAQRVGIQKLQKQQRKK